MIAKDGKLNISEISRLYGKDRSLIHDLIKKNNISVERQQKPNRTFVQLTDIIQYWGEPTNSPTPQPVTGRVRNSQETTANITPILEEKITLLKQQIEELRRDKEEYKQREERLLSLVEKQTLILEDKREKSPIQPTSEQPEDKTKPQKSRLGFWTLFVGGIAITIIMTALVTIWILHSDNPLGFIPSIISQFFT